MSKLTAKRRKSLGDSAFVFPGERRYPIHDLAHARNALARASGKPEEARVRAAVHSKYPEIGKEAMVAGFVDELEKIAWSSAKFREGIVDEGIPLAGATIGARYGGLRGAALGYAAGGGASIARSYAKGEKPSMQRKLLAGGALGYGLGGGAHALLEHASKGAKAGRGMLGKMKPAFHPPKGATTRLSRTVEEALPAAGATVATGVAAGSGGEKKKTAGYGKAVPKWNGVQTGMGGMGVPAPFAVGAQMGSESRDAIKARVLREQKAGVRTVKGTKPVGKAVNALRPQAAGFFSKLFRR